MYDVYFEKYEPNAYVCYERYVMREKTKDFVARKNLFCMYDIDLDICRANNKLGNRHETIKRLEQTGEIPKRKINYGSRWFWTEKEYKKALAVIRTHTRNQRMFSPLIEQKIKALFVSGVKQVEIAKQFNTKQYMVSRICTRN